VTVSPNADWGYDVADYKAVCPELGSLDDLDELVREAERLRIRVVIDLVPNHTSDRHQWFRDARSSRSAPHRDWYVWADPKPDGAPPNNWASSFGGPAWTLDDETGQHYLHNFLPEQPDLNWWNEQVRDAFDEILRFWFDRGIAGFRIDVCHGIVKDRDLRDNPPAGDNDHWTVRARGQRPVYNANRPEVHEVLRRWRRIADTYDPPRLLLGETYVFDIAELAAFYGEGDELDLGFNFSFLFAKFEADPLRSLVEATEAGLPGSAWPVWTGSNHDASRFPTRWAAGDAGKARCAMLMLLTLRGTPVLYQGDEIGLVDTDVGFEDLCDPVGKRFWPLYRGRDPERTPMPWQTGPGAGFTVPGATPWLPFGDVSACNVEDQRDDPSSMLTLTRQLLALRRESPDLRRGDYRSLPAPDGVWAWRRGDRVAVALNLSDDAAVMPGLRGRVRLGTAPGREGERVQGELGLAPWEGVIVALEPGSGPA
ncbi:MAG TPA: alpha-amylase family glycosyl hydrolase, partial [Acidimicrobiales bacterium]|nr:alpha-amylase family glycosyl hydrolase [Acidimicrobiales bacterium]